MHELSLTSYGNAAATTPTKANGRTQRITAQSDPKNHLAILKKRTTTSFYKSATKRPVASIQPQPTQPTRPPSPV